MKTARIGWILIGAFAGIALVLACEHGGGGMDASGLLDAIGAGSDAQAAPSDCATWQVVRVQPSATTGLKKLFTGDLCEDGTVDTTNSGCPGHGVYLGLMYEFAGWEPFAVLPNSVANNAAEIWFRRCKP